MKQQIAKITGATMRDGKTTFEKTLIDLFDAQVSQTPDRIALVFENSKLTYLEMNTRVTLLAKYLIDKNVRKDELVGICIERSLEMVIGIFAVLKAGAAYVPIDPSYPQERISYILNDTQAKLLLCSGALLPQLEFYQNSTTLVPIDTLDFKTTLPDFVFPEIHPQSLAYIIYTSGSTGMPKGVMIEHGSLLNRLIWAQGYNKLTDSDVILQKTTYCFDVSVWELLWPFLTGAKLVMAKPGGQKDNEYLKKIIEEEKVTMLHFVPSMLGMFLHTINRGDCPSLTKVLCSGEALKYSHVKLFFEKLPNTELHNLYGPTEAAIDVTYWDAKKEFNPNSEIIPIGRPVSNTFIYILNEKNEKVPDGEIGELHIGGIQVARGYLNRADLTREKFIPDPFSNQPRARMYKSGDLARVLPDGNIEYLGRIDHQVKIRGYRIELGEIEYQLLSQENVKETVATAFETKIGDQRLVAYVQLKKQGTSEAQLINAWKKHLLSSMPSYMVPDIFMIVPEFPFNSSGKIDRKKLPPPTFQRPQNLTIYKKPITDFEKKLAGIWSVLLLIDEIGIDDNFFELGGNSLSAQRFVNTLKTDHYFDIPITKLYQNPTIAGLQKLFEGNKAVLHIPKENRKPGSQNSCNDIAVIGLECNFPGTDTIEGFWDILVNGKETTRFFELDEIDSEVPDQIKKDPTYVRARGVIENVDLFDPEFFGIGPRLAELMDPQQRIFLQVSRNLLEKTGYLPQKNGAVTAVFAGCATNTYFNNNVVWHKNKMDLQGGVPVSSVSDKDYITSRVSYQLNLSGPAVNVNTACSTSLVAIVQAVESLRAGQCDTAIAGGAAITVPVNSGHLYQEGSMLSADGHCRPFDADAKGTVFSDGVGAVLLKRLDDAIEDGDPIYAVVKGVGINNDGGNKGSFTAPSAEGQAAAIAMAYRDAKIAPEHVSYIETHGTATPLGDPIEIEGLKLAFGDQDKKQYCAIGSVKSNFGHLTHAAGVAGFIKTALALHYKMLPPSINFTKPNPHIDFASSPFIVNSKLKEWNTDGKLIAGISSLGVGGTNAHVVLEAYIPEKKETTKLRPETHQLICWSAHHENSITAYVEKLEKFIAAHPNLALQDVAATLLYTRQDLNVRNFVVAQNGQELTSKLSDRDTIAASTHRIKEQKSNIVFLFPGQGNQYLNMGLGLYESEKVFKDAVDECAVILQKHMGEDIRDVIFSEKDNDAASEKLKNTKYTQPAIFTISYALAKLYMSWGIKPAAFAGHSIGEYVGAHLAGIFSLKDVLKIVAERGRSISELPSGSMLSVRAAIDQVQPILPAALSIAAQNAKNLCVVSGEHAFVEQFSALLTEKGITNKLLKTSHAFHSAMMEPAVPLLKAVVEPVEMKVPKVPVLSTVTADWLKDNEATSADYWADHIRATVRFGDALKKLHEELNPIFLEVGPGTSSSVFAKQNGTGDTVVSSLNINATASDEVVSVKTALGKIWQFGGEIDWNQLYPKKEYTVLHDLPTYAFNNRRLWVDAPASVQITPPKSAIAASGNKETSPASGSEAVSKKEVIINRVKEIIEAASGISVAEANPLSNFAELGLDSLLLTQLASTLKREFSFPVTFRQLSEDYDNLDKLGKFYEKSIPYDKFKEIFAIADTTAEELLQTEVSEETATVVESSVSENANAELMKQMMLQIETLKAQVAALQRGTASNSSETTFNKDAPKEVVQTTTPLILDEPDANVEKTIETTESQKEVIAACLLGDKYANLAYNLSLSLHFKGNLNVEVLKESLQELILRHESLRATFNEEGSEMIIFKTQLPQLQFEDLSKLDPVEQQKKVDAYLLKDAETEFVLTKDHLVRFAIFTQSDSKSILTLTAHHIVCDGWSLGILLEEIGKLYSAKISGSAVPEKPLQFSTYAAHEAAFINSPGYKEIVDYWKKEYEGNIPVFELQPDFSRPPVRTYTGRRDDYILPTSIADAVKKTGARYGSSFVNTLMSAFEILLYKVTGNRDIVLGLPTAGQSATEMFSLVGHCVNLLPLRSQPDPDLSFSDYLKARKSKTLRDYENQQFTFGTLLKELKIPRDLSRMPLVPVSLNIDMGMDALVKFQGLEYKLVHNKRVAETYELFLNIADCEEGNEFQWSYNTQLYKPSTMKGLMDKYTYLLTQIVSNADQKIADLKLEDSQTLANYWQHWNSRADDGLYEGTILDKLTQSFNTNKGKTALSYKGASVNYQDLDQQSNQMANLLIAKGVKPGTVVGVAMERSIDLVVSIIGIVKAGATFIPLDPQYAQERIEYMLNNAEAGYLITSSIFKGKLLTQAQEICFEDIRSELSTSPTTLPAISVTPKSLVYILYTSGSTGKPKGVMIANKSLVNYISWAIKYYLKGTAGVFPLYTSISFDLTITSIFAPLVSGSEIRIFEEDEPANMLEKIFTDGQINVIKLTPSHLKLVRDSEQIRTRLTAQHRTLIVGGEELESAVAKDIHSLCNGNVLICNEYGPTEATVGCMIHDYNPAEEYAAVPIGVPISNATIYLLDQQLNPVSKGITGEIYIGGVCVSEGYFNNELLTKERFLDDPFVPGGKMYKTGDNAIMLENDLLMFKGRIDDQVKLRGYRIELGEIDYHLAAIPDVKNCITIVREDTPGNAFLVSYVSLQDVKKESDFDKESLRLLLSSKLPDYMVPTVYVLLDQLPLTANGKVDKKQLPAPELQQQQYVAPETAEEILLTTIWSEVFNKDLIGVYDNFFELGGHSLLGVRVVNIIKAKTGVNLGATSIFRYPVLRTLAGELAKAKAKSRISATPREEEWYLTPLNDISVTSFKATEPQLEIWQECIIGGEKANRAYNVAHAEYLEGSLNLDLLKQAIQQLINRHELLRATFGEEGNLIYLHADAQPPLLFIDITERDDVGQQNYIKEYLEKQENTPFDLEKDILFRINILKLNNTMFLFNLIIHHLICDGGSFDTFIRELSIIYNALLKGDQPVLDQAIPFSSYSSYQHKLYESEAYKKDVAYWVSQFDNDVPAAIELPYDFPFPAERTYESYVEYYALSDKETEALEKIALDSGTTLTILLRTLFDVFIYKYTGQKEFVIGLPLSAQVSVPGYSQIGHSINMLPIRTLVNNELSFKTFLQQRHEEMLNDFDHQKITFGSLIKNIKLDRSSNKNTLISVSFGSQMEKSGYTLSLDHIKHEAIESNKSNIQLDLFVDAYKKDEKAIFQVYFKSDLFKPETIQNLLEGYHSIIRQIIEKPEISISYLRINGQKSVFDLSLEQYGHEILNLNIIDLFGKAVTAHPDNIAVRMGEDALTYDELNRRSNQLAHYLVAKGLNRFDRVAIVLDRSISIIVSILATLKCGAAYIPIDPHYPGDRVSFMVSDAEAHLMITSTEFADLIDINTPKIYFDELTSQLEQHPTTDPEISFESDTLAYILYTSGSTGKPKGAMVTHRNLIHFLRGMQEAYQITQDSKFLSVSSISFDASCFDNYLSMVNGAELVLTDNETIKDGQLLLNEVKSRGITIILATPVTFKLMLAADWTEKLPVSLLSAGETLLPSLAKELLPRCQTLYNVYGPTETTVICTLTRVVNDSRITIGAPIVHTPIYILDEKLHPVQEGEMGEIHIGGNGVSNGYWNRKDLTAEKFIADPFSKQPGARMYKSGDLGRWKKNGEIKYEGRVDNQVKIRGFRIELGEIEYHLAKCDNIKDVAISVREDQHGEKNIVAYIIPTNPGNSFNEGFSKEEILNWNNQLRVNLPYFMVPTFWVPVEVFPLSPNGKVDVKKLASPNFSSRRGAETADNLTEELEHNLNSTELAVKRIWEEELGISGLLVDDNFFELGGHSMAAVRVMRKIKNELKAELPIASLFQYPTITSLAAFVNSKAKHEHKILVSIKTTGSRPPLYLIHGGALNILLYKNLEPFLSEDQPLYGIQALGLDGDISGLENIESISNRYLEEILDQNPDGPYSIVGYSLGGIIAFEMARQLISMGKTIHFLGIFDTNVSNREKPANTLDYLWQGAKRQIKKAYFIGSNLLQSPKEVIRYQRNVFQRKFNKNFKEDEDEQVYDYSEQVADAYRNAYVQYAINPLDVKVNLFRVKDRIYFVDDLKYLGWSKYAKKGVIVYDVPGDHKTFLLEPNNEYLVNQLEKALTTVSTG